MSEFFSLMRFTIFKEGKETLLLTAQPHKELNNVIHNNLFIFFIPFILFIKNSSMFCFAIILVLFIHRIRGSDPFGGVKVVR